MAGIFRDPSKLSPRYIPERLPHRESYIEQIASFFHPGSEHATVVQVQGPAGCGKTSSAYHAGRRLEMLGRERGINVKSVYLNLKLESPTRFVLYKRLLDKVEPAASSRSLSAEELLERFLRVVRTKGLKPLIIVDEIDYFLRTSKDTSVVYDLTRLNELALGEGTNVLGLVLIARDPSWRRRLDRAELSTLGQLVVNMPRYTVSELYDILEYRSFEAFRPGTVGGDVLEFVADVTFKEAGGDVRYALDVLYYSGLVADREDSDCVKPDHVRRVLAQLNPTITSEDLSSLSDHERLALLAVAYALRESKSPYVSFTDVAAHYKSICEERGVRRLGLRTLEDVLQRLSDRGIVQVRGIKRIGIAEASLDRLIPMLDGLISRINLQGSQHPS